MDGLILTLRLAGINNRNFLMRDERTGSYWQQISGRAISGPLAGRSLRLIPSDELTFALWKAEQPKGSVLRESPADAALYGSRAIEEFLGEAPPPLRPAGLPPREPVIGIDRQGAAKAWPQAAIARAKLIRDRVSDLPVILLTGPDGESVRAFTARLAGSDDPAEFYQTEAGVMMDDRTGSRWNFQGCATLGPLTGQCLARVEIAHDYWFAWKRYHPEPTIYTGARGRQALRGARSS